jgi:hypothetical protein
LWEVGGANILVDPILVGSLDFGIPWLYDAAKKVLKNFQVLLLLIFELLSVNCLRNFDPMLFAFLVVQAYTESI